MSMSAIILSLTPLTVPKGYNLYLLARRLDHKPHNDL